MLISLLQDVVWVPNLLPDVHGLGRTLGPVCACPTVGILALPLASLPAWPAARGLMGRALGGVAQLPVVTLAQRGFCSEAMATPTHSQGCWGVSQTWLLVLPLPTAPF